MSILFFFFKQKTAYEVRISDWSSDVCSSDLLVETSDDKPIPRAAARDRSEPTIPPLCDTIPIDPTGKWSISSALLADKGMPRVKLTSPMVLGDRKRVE